MSSSACRTLSKVATPLMCVQQIHGRTSTLTCHHAPTPLCPSHQSEPGQEHHHWKAHAVCLTQGELRHA